MLNELKTHLIGDIFQVDTYYAKSMKCYDCQHRWTNAECITKDDMQDVYKIMGEAITTPGKQTPILLSFALHTQGTVISY